MRIQCIKTKKGAPMQVCDEFTVTADEGREFWLVNVYPFITYQTVQGFGGAFTEAAATTLARLGKENQEKILRLYFDPEAGIGYNLGRVHINSCDFSLGNYTYVADGDKTLESFDIAHDRQAIIPMIRAAMEYTPLTMMASPWSPPAYMKTNGQMNGGGQLKKEYYELWSAYYVKFIEAYAAEGIPFRYITVQNEAKAVQTWDSCVYSAEEERELVRSHLGEKMQKLGVKILFWDHNKERIIDRACVTLDGDDNGYFSGVAFHWYSGDHFGELDAFHALYPDREMIFTEGCYEYSLGALDTVKIGEKYAHDIIGNFNHYCNAFCDWNLLLDEKGGPNHVGNYCDAPIMADTRKDEIEIHDSYYYIGHFSKYVKRGAKRIASSVFTTDLEVVSFKNPDGDVVSVVLNRTDRDIPFAFKICGKIVESKAEAHSIATFLFDDLV